MVLNESVGMKLNSIFGFGQVTLPVPIVRLNMCNCLVHSNTTQVKIILVSLEESLYWHGIRVYHWLSSTESFSKYLHKYVLTKFSDEEKLEAIENWYYDMENWFIRNYKILNKKINEKIFKKTCLGQSGGVGISHTFLPCGVREDRCHEAFKSSVVLR